MPIQRVSCASARKRNITVETKSFISHSVFPDAVTRMVACMVQDVDIMGLCGETKIANKSETWVTMIQGGFLTNGFISALRLNFHAISQSSNTISPIIKPRHSNLCGVV